jgi:hypothetical protein
MFCICVCTVVTFVFSLLLFQNRLHTINISGSPYPNYHDFRVGGSYKIDFLKVSSEPTTAIPDSTTPNHDTTTASQETTVTNVTF